MVERAVSGYKSLKRRWIKNGKKGYFTKDDVNKTLQRVKNPDNPGVFPDGSDSGGNQEGARSWAKIQVDAPSVIVRSEVTLAFPMLVAGSFYKKFKKKTFATL